MCNVCFCVQKRYDISPLLVVLLICVEQINIYIYIYKSYNVYQNKYSYKYRLSCVYTYILFIKTYSYTYAYIYIYLYTHIYIYIYINTHPNLSFQASLSPAWEISGHRFSPRAANHRCKSLSTMVSRGRGGRDSTSCCQVSGHFFEHSPDR